ncbi:hypothetical protein [Flavobacterium orientale]|jgi:hypothetical protein|uniref:VCBS repeat-containing protein n=1 Tax=Flavobacterium orientale TaxID=1756020 RepID=A0A917D9V0_9FLAO|nr:hypothetical protein [Flavobacterium orientale]GGD15464.1 hypothetical protein GCM10011343_03000 [Flavobacterium orientale]
MRFIFTFLSLFWFGICCAQDGISLEKVVKADFDGNGFEDVAYYTQEKSEEFDTVQIEVYFYGIEGITHEVKSEKIIFNKSESEDHLLCYSFTFSENTLNLIFTKNKINYYWFFEYNDNDFELLYYGESERTDDFQKFRYLNLKASKLAVSQLKKDATEWETVSLPFTVITIPTLNAFKGYEVKWTK